MKRPAPRKKAPAEAAEPRLSEGSNSAEPDLTPLLGGQDPAMIQALALIRANNELAPHEAFLVPRLRQGIHLNGKPTTMAKVPVGASRLGAWPDLPKKVAWPQDRRRPLRFFAQIHLPSLPAAIPDFPTSGTLWFFHRWFEGSDEASLVFYDESATDGLVRTEPPKTLPGDDQFAPLSLSMKPVMTLPSEPFEEDAKAKSAAERDEREEKRTGYYALRDIWRKVTGEYGRHQFGGHPNDLQSPKPANQRAGSPPPDRAAAAAGRGQQPGRRRSVRMVLG